MKKLLYVFKILIPLLVISLASSCRDDFEPIPASGNLTFSRDTVFLDTVFSNISSSTYNLKVYNRSDNYISIPRIALAQAENSAYRLNVDGMAGKSFENINILPKDSIFIFIEVTLDASQQAEGRFLYTDQILFENSENNQKVELVTLVQDAVFLYPQRDAQGIKQTLELGTDADGNPILIEGFLLDDDQLVFTRDKPYVIYGFAAVPQGKTMQIEAGSRLHFHEGSGLLLGNGARLDALGMPSMDQELLENEIIFEGDRLESQYADVPGQWGTIWFTPGSTGDLNYVSIKNNTIGILVDGNTGGSEPDVHLKNSKIYNSALMGLYGLTGSILGQNIIIANSGISNAWLRLGGHYEFVHSTFANYWDLSFRNTPAVQIDNYLETPDALLVADLSKAVFTNCIIYGNNTEELSLKAVDDVAFNYSFSSSLLRFDDRYDDYKDQPVYNFENSNLFSNLVLSQEPNFRDTSRNDYRINLESAAAGLGNSSGATQVPFDITGTPRNEQVDAGAYQAIDFEN